MTPDNDADTFNRSINIFLPGWEKITFSGTSSSMHFLHSWNAITRERTQIPRNVLNSINKVWYLKKNCIDQLKIIVVWPNVQFQKYMLCSRLIWKKYSALVEESFNLVEFPWNSKRILLKEWNYHVKVKFDRQVGDSETTEQWIMRPRHSTTYCFQITSRRFVQNFWHGNVAKL